jgi:lipopolysaccharide exporter
MGRYEVARDLAASATDELVTPMVFSLMPVMAKVQDDKTMRRNLYMNVLHWSALICTSTSVGVALVAQDMADIVLGPQWSDVGVLIPWFALTAGILGLSSSVYSAFDTIGQPMKGARLQWIRVVMLTSIIGPVAYIYQTIASVAIARLVITILVTPTLFYALSRTLDMPMRDFTGAIWRPVLAGLFMAIVVLTLNFEVHLVGIGRLLLDMAAGAIAYAASLIVLWHLVGRPDGPEADAHHYLRKLGGAAGLWAT